MQETLFGFPRGSPFQGCGCFPRKTPVRD